jgi:3-hydroxyisobutyrate dehydrogenase-like beta-hydroxyacid dehydrogenase
VRHVGDLGCGARLKLVANSLFGAVTLASAELQVAGEGAGLAPEVVFSILARFVPSLEPRRDGYAERRHSHRLSAIRDLRKDLHLATRMFEKADSAVPITSLVRQLLDDLGPEGSS